VAVSAIRGWLSDSSGSLLASCVCTHARNMPVSWYVLKMRPLTRCLEGTLWWSPEGARCSLTCRLAAPVLAGRGLASLGICHRWLPSWLPAIRQTSSGCAKVRAVSSGASASLGQLRYLGNQARDYPRPKAATPGRGPAYLEHDRPGAAAASSPPSQHGTMK
jgi:hypothetical protein